MKIISTINVKMITLKNLVQKIFSHPLFKKTHPYTILPPPIIGSQEANKIHFPLKKESV